MSRKSRPETPAVSPQLAGSGAVGRLYFLVLMRARAILPFLLVAALFSVVVVLPFVPDARSPGFFKFVVTLRSDQTGVAQLYWDNGGGLAETRSTRQLLVADVEATLEFALPPERLVGLRFDPLNRPGRLEIISTEITARDGRVVRAIPVEAWRAEQQIATAQRENGRLTIATLPDAHDPILVAGDFAPLDLAKERTGNLGFVAARAAVVFVALLALGVLPWARWRQSFAHAERWQRARRWGDAHPSGVIALIAGLAMVASSYPVIFLGQSYVSPSLGAALLYPGVPSLPGMTSTAAAEVKQADVGAIMWQHVPYSMQQRDALRQGELPLWNRYNSGGVALLGQGQSSFGDPLQLLPWLGDGAAWAWDLKFLLARWLLGFGVGLQVWALTRHRGAALLLAASAPFIGLFIYRVNHPAIFSLSYAPWVLVTWSSILTATTWRQLTWRAVGWIVANVALLCSGTAKESTMLLVGLNSAGLLQLLFAARPWSARLQRLAAMVLAGVVFVLLTAPHWLLFLETLRQSYTTYDQPRAYQLPPGLLAALFDEIFHRPFQQDGGVINPSANFLALIGLGWVVVRWRAAWAHHGVRALLVATVPPALLAFAIIPPAWVTAVPGLAGIMHVDNTFSCVLIVLVLALAGWGWQQCFLRLGTPEGRAEGMLVLLLVLGVVALHYGTAHAVLRSLIVEFSWGLRSQTDAWYHGYVLSLVLATAGVLWVVRRRLVSGHWTPATLLFAVLCLLALHWRHGMQAATGNRNYVLVPTERADFRATSPAIAFLQEQVAREPARVAGLGATLFPGWSGAYSLEGINGPDALVNPYYRELLLAGGVPQLWDWRFVLEAPTVPPLRAFLDALNLAFLVVPHGDPYTGAGGYDLVSNSDLHVYRSRTAWPRAFFVDRAVAYETLPQAVELLRSAEGQPLALVSPGDAPASLRVGSPDGRTVTPARDYWFTTNSTRFTIDAPAAGLAVLTEAFVPGAFEVTVNDRPAAYFRVNHAFRGIVLPQAGEYRICFTYRPALLRPALALSAAGLLLLGVAVWLGPRRGSLLA